MPVLDNPPPGLNWGDSTGHLYIGSAPEVDMHTAAWCMLNLLPLWTEQQQPRGKNVIIPESVGKLIRPTRTDEARLSLPMALTGKADQSNAGTADEWAGLQANLAYLDTNLVQATRLATGGFLAARLVMPDTTTLTADVQVLNVKLGTNFKSVVRATLELVIPAGRFV